MFFFGYLGCGSRGGSIIAIMRARSVANADHAAKSGLALVVQVAYLGRRRRRLWTRRPGSTYPSPSATLVTSRQRSAHCGNWIFKTGSPGSASRGSLQNALVVHTASSAGVKIDSSPLADVHVHHPQFPNPYFTVELTTPVISAAGGISEILSSQNLAAASFDRSPSSLGSGALSSKSTRRNTSDTKASRMARIWGNSPERRDLPFDMTMDGGWLAE